MSRGATQGKGRPLRFLAWLGVAWIGVRVLFLGTLAIESEEIGQESDRAAFTVNTEAHLGSDTR